MKNYLFNIIFLTGFFLFGILLTGSATIKPDKLTCEYIENPLGIDTRIPRFSWTLVSAERNQKQTTYELLVNDNLKDINALHGKIWKSGKIKSSQSLHIVYQGKALKSFTRYYWRVRVYDQNGKASSWSKPAWFETAMLDATDWKAKWIGDGSVQFKKDEDFYQNDPMPLFRKDFTAKKKISSARLYISALGYYEAYLNGQKIGDQVLDPGWTSYNKQILYAVHDVTKNIREGDNVTGIMVGNGWYNILPLRLWGGLNMRNALVTGRPCVKAQLRIQYTDGSSEVITTDDTWKTISGPIVRNSIYIGEHYDARLEQNGWNGTEGVSLKGVKNAVEVKGPSGEMAAQMQPPIRVTKIVKPIGIKEIKPGVFIFDMGQNFAGVARISVQGAAGTHIVLRYGEDIYADGSLNVMTSVTGQIKGGQGGPGAPQVAWQEDSYILKGKGKEVWEPRFTFHGFRYVEVTGWPGIPTLNDIEGLRLSADLEQAGEFSCSNEMFNKVNEISKWTFLSNVFSVQSDCPAREKLGYGGDIVGTAEAFMYNFDMANFYKKVIQDLRNDQRDGGGFTETAPYVGIADRGQGGGTGPLGWQLAYPLLLKHLYDFYGDKRVIEEGYSALRKQIDFLHSQAKDNLFDEDISDHEALDTKPVALTAAAFYYHHIKLLTEIAGILGKTSDSIAYAKLANEVKDAIVKKYPISETGQVDNGTQSAQIFALWYDLPSKDLKEIVFNGLEQAFAAKKWHLSTGIFATKMMFDILRDHDRNDFAYRIANQRDFPGWGFMVEKGATTLWETWAYSDNTFSQNHPMFGSINEWFYRSLLGINSAKAGFERITIKPQPANDLMWAKGSYNSVRGKISSSWRIENGQFKLNVSIPANSTAEIWVPLKGNGFEQTSANPVNKSKDIRFLKSESGYNVYQVGSGDYSF